MKLYLCAARNSSSVSATFAFSGVVTFFQTLPSGSVTSLGDRAVGIDGVAGVQQKIRAMLAHGGEGEHAAVIRVDAPALSGDVATPDETDVTPIGWRGAEAPDHRLALDAGMREVAKPDAVEDLLPGRQVLQQHFRGEVAFGQRRDRRQRPGVGKGFRRRDLDQHLRRTVGARPYHAAIGADVAGLHA